MIFPVSVFENDLCRISVTDMDCDMACVTMDFEVENLTEEKLSVLLNSPYINGLAAEEIYMGAISNTGPKEVQKMHWTFSNNNKKLVGPEPVICSPEELKRFDARCNIETENGDYINESIECNLTGETYNAAAQFDPEQNVTLALDNEVIQGYNGDLVVGKDILGLTISSELVLVNKSDRAMIITFSKEMTVNDQTCSNIGENSDSDSNPKQFLAPHSVDYTKVKGLISRNVDTNIKSAEDVQDMSVDFAIYDFKKTIEEGSEAGMVAEGTLQRAK